MKQTILKEAGLSGNEIKIYLALLKLGACPVNKLYEETGVHRRNIYDSVNKLIEKGLASYIIEKKTKSVQAANPQKLITFLEEQKRAIDEKEQRINEILPELIKDFNFPKHEQEAEIYRGNEGIKAIFEDMLNYKANYFIGAGGYIAERFPYYWPGYNRRRIRLGVKWHALGVTELRGKPITQERLVDYKYLPKALSGVPNVIFIYGDKVANVLWSEKPIAFLIKDKQIANNYKKYFSYLWKTIK